MSIDWTKTGNTATQAAMAVLGNNWKTVSGPASAQMAALVVTGQQIEQHKDKLSKLEYDSLRLTQQRTLETVFSCAEAISIVTAEQAAAAAWNVVAQALKVAYNLPFIP